MANIGYSVIIENATNTRIARNVALALLIGIVLVGGPLIYNHIRNSGSEILREKPGIERVFSGKIFGEGKVESGRYGK